MKQHPIPLVSQARHAANPSFPARMKQWFAAHAGMISFPALHLSPHDTLPPHQRRFGLLAVAALVAGYTAVMFSYVFALHETEQTHAEDLGIMDQVLWNSAHGHFWHQTICNSVSDLNCMGDVSRWAIHFEPLMVLLVPLYWLGAGPHVLQFIQVFGVALGALPAYWLGSRRLQHVGAGVLLALLYLTMPTLVSAVTYDFHMVTLAAPLLMFALYFLYARNTPGLIITCLLALGTKEQIALDVFMIGLAASVLQHRWRVGAALMGLATGWALLALTVIHLASPLGASPTAMRYGSLAATLQRLPLVVSDPQRRAYLVALWGNTKWVGIFAPWIVALAAPSILLNALSDNVNQYSGRLQYNADIAPFLVVAMLEGGLVLLALMARLAAWLCATRAVRQFAPLRVPLVAFSLPMVLSVNLAMLPEHVASLNLSLQMWPVPSAHTAEFYQVLRRIPPTASVSAQAEIVPHLSQRRAIYQFPDADDVADYIFLDEDSDYYPEPSQQQYDSVVSALLQAPTVQVLYDHDGFVLLENVASLGSTP